MLLIVIFEQCLAIYLNFWTIFLSALTFVGLFTCNSICPFYGAWYPLLWTCILMFLFLCWLISMRPLSFWFFSLFRLTRHLYRLVGWRNLFVSSFTFWKDRQQFDRLPYKSFTLMIFSSIGPSALQRWLLRTVMPLALALFCWSVSFLGMFH